MRAQMRKAAIGQRMLPASALLLLATVAVLPVAAPAEAQPRPKPSPKAPVLARSCSVTPPDLDPLFPAPARANDADDQDSDDDNDDNDDDDDDDDSAPGLMLPGSSTCLAISGTVTAGLQHDSYRIRNAAAPPSGFTWQPNASLRIETSHDLASGLRIGTAFEFSIRPDSGQPDTTSLDEATVLIGPFTFGLSDSRFNFWTGDEFAFSTRLPSRTTGLLAWERALTESWSLALAIEDPGLSSSSPVPTSRSLMPDGVGRLVYEAGPWTVHLAGVLRNVAGPSPRLGRAGIVGATYEASILGRPGNITAQIAGGVDAASYIGSQLDAAAAGQFLRSGDPNRAFSAVIAARREWTDQLASNIYVSRYQISVPLLGSKGKLRVDRLAANLVWTPVTGLKAGIETSYADSRVAVTGRIVPATLSGRSLSTQLFIERSF